MPLSITIADQTAIGAVVSNWAFAESQFEHLIGIMSHNTAFPLHHIAPDRLVSFSQKVAVAKKLTKALCSSHARHQEVARSIFSVGKQLSNQRKIAAHWIPTRDAPEPKRGVRFVDLGAPWSMHVHQVEWRLKELNELREDIENWSASVTQFSASLTFPGGPLESLGRIHGPWPDVDFLGMAAARTTLRNRPIPTR